MSSKSKRYCSVPQCNNYVSAQVSMHYFPKDKEMQKKWVIALKIGKKVTRYMNVCSAHFLPSDYFQGRKPNKRSLLKKNACPSQNLPVRQFDSQIIKQKRRKIERKIVEDIMKQMDVEETFDDPKTPEEPEPESEPGTSISGVVEKVTQSSKEDKECQTNLDENFLEKVMKSDKNFTACTGVTKDIFSSLLICLEKSSEILHTTKISIKEKLLLFLFKLKTNNTFSVISVIFNLPYSTARRYFWEMLEILYTILKPIIFIPDREQHILNIPKCFKKFRNVRVVLDCTEIDVQKSKCLSCRIRSYSNYKKRHTLKYLIGVTPAGLICFVSSAYGGRTSDKAIVCKENFLDLLEPYMDAVMVDKGVLIERECLEKGIKLIRPPFLRQKKQFTKQEAAETAEIARARVHVERAIQRIKRFNIVNEKIDFTFIPYATEIMFVICCLVNLTSPILSDTKF